MIICAGVSESFTFAHSIGIGLVNSAINLTKLVIEHKPDELVFVGTCGSYGEFDIFDTVFTQNASQLEHSLLLNTSFSPIKNLIVSHETDPIINSSNYITTDKKISKSYISKGIGLENMEFYSVLSVAKSFDIRAKGIFVVTNYCDENAHSDFIKNHEKAKRMIEEIIKGRD